MFGYVLCSHLLDLPLAPHRHKPRDAHRTRLQRADWCVQFWSDIMGAVDATPPAWAQTVAWLFYRAFLLWYTQARFTQYSYTQDTHKHTQTHVHEHTHNKWNKQMYSHFKVHVNSLVGCILFFFVFFSFFLGDVILTFSASTVHWIYKAKNTDTGI